MQEVEIYYSILRAKEDMELRISKGWRVHTCTPGYYTTAHGAKVEGLLVVYERYVNSNIVAIMDTEIV